MTNGPSDRPGDGRHARGLRARPLALAVGAAVPVGVLWLALSLATGLIYHFMPGAMFLASTWAFRWATRGGRASWAEAVAVTIGAGAVTAVGLVAVPAAGGALDDPREIAAVILVGAGLALVWLRRPGATEATARRFAATGRTRTGLTSRIAAHAVGKAAQEALHSALACEVVGGGTTVQHTPEDVRPLATRDCEQPHRPAPVRRLGSPSSSHSEWEVSSMTTTTLSKQRIATGTWVGYGLIGGLVAGIVFAMFEMIMAVVRDGSEAFFMPLRMIGAIGLGASALDPTTALVSAGGAGLVIHMMLSMMYGVIVAGVLAFVPPLSRTTASVLIVSSLAGFGLWVLNFFILARIFGWTWFPDTQNVAIQFVAHTFMFGTVLGLVLDRFAFRPAR